jgi:hypothetical protein
MYGSPTSRFWPASVLTVCTVALPWKLVQMGLKALPRKVA